MHGNDKTLSKQIKEFKKDSILTPVFMILEVVVETLIPLLMASIVDKGVNGRDLNHIYMVGGVMFLLALCGLLPALWADVSGFRFNGFCTQSPAGHV